MNEVRIVYLYPSIGAALKPGDKLVDLSIDLSRDFAQNCPPISFYRIIVRESLIFRGLLIEVGQCCKLNDAIALFSNTELEPLDQPPQRPIRFTTVGISHHPQMWSILDDL